MTDQATDTQDASAGTQTDDAATAASKGGSQGGQDQVSLLTSRLNGQTAKVGELTGTIKAKDARISELETALEDLRTGKVSSEDAAKAQVDSIQKLLDAERAGRRTDALKGRFPEAFSELGDDIAAVMDETKLAAIEARLTGSAGESGEDEPPTPLRHNETKTGGTSKVAKEETAADVEARLLSMPAPW